MTLRKVGRLIASASIVALSNAVAGAAGAQDDVIRVEDGSIVGEIRDAQRDRALTGVNVQVVETGQSAVTDVLGRYRLPNVSPGSYTLRLRYFGLPTRTVRVVVASGETQEVNARLGEDEQGDVVIVTGRRSATASALNRQRNADGVSSVISADSLGRFPDATAAEALNRLPGVSFQREERSGEGQFISIRGLDSSLNNVQINGLNSAQANAAGDRRVPLDVFQAESLATVTINKSLLPRNESEGVGGSVELEQARPLSVGKDQFRLSLEGREQEVNDRTGFKIAGTVNKVFGDNFGVLVSGSFRRRNRLAFEIESQTVDTIDPFSLGFEEGAAPLFIPQALAINANANIDEDVDIDDLLESGAISQAEFDTLDSLSDIFDDGGISPQLGTPDVFPSTLIGLQYSLFDDQRDDLTLSGAIDWKPAEHTTLSILGSFNREDVRSTRSTIRLDAGEDGDEDDDEDDDVFPEVDAGAAPIDLGAIFPDFAGSGLFANPGDEVFAPVEQELFFRAEEEPERGTNLSLTFQGETVLDRLKLNYRFGYARAVDGSAGLPQPQLDFEPEDLDDDDFQDNLDILVESGALTQSQADFISLRSIFPGGPVFTETTDDAQGDLIEDSNDRDFFIFQDTNLPGPQLANSNVAALQAALLTPDIFLLDDASLEFEQGFQERFSAKFDAEYAVQNDWIDTISAGVKFERAERTTTGFNSFVQIQEDDFFDLLQIAGVDASQSLNELTLADLNDPDNIGFQLLNDQNVDLTPFNGVQTVNSFLQASSSGNFATQILILDSIDAFLNDPDSVVETATNAAGETIVVDVTNGDLSLVSDILNGIPITPDFQVGDGILGLIPETQVDESIFSGYLQSKLTFGEDDRWEVIGGVRVEYADVNISAPQLFNVELIDQNAAGLFVGTIDLVDPATGDEIDDAPVGVAADGSVILEETGEVLGLFSEGFEGEIDFETSAAPQLVFSETEGDYFEVLPRFQVNYRHRDYIVFRGAVWTAIARPSFINLAQPTVIAFAQNDDPFDAQFNVEAGNPDLENTYSWNFDLGVEYYWGDAGAVTFNLFYKDIQDFIFVNGTPVAAQSELPSFITDGLASIDPDLVALSGAPSIELPQDGIDARLFGFEVAIQRQFDFLPGIWNGLGVFGNLTLQDTEATIPLGLPAATVELLELAGADTTILDLEEDGSLITEAQVPFFNAPDMIATASLFYDANGIDAALTYQFQSEILANFNNGFGASTFEQTFDQLDFTLKVQLPFDYPQSTLSFGVTDVLNGGNDPVTFTTFGQSGGATESAEFIGRTFTFGLSVQF
ncbi:MAG: TonB-dependent receptor [Parvularculaceae bacterium]